MTRTNPWLKIVKHLPPQGSGKDLVGGGWDFRFRGSRRGVVDAILGVRR